LSSKREGYPIFSPGLHCTDSTGGARDKWGIPNPGPHCGFASHCSDSFVEELDQVAWLFLAALTFEYNIYVEIGRVAVRQLCDIFSVG